MPTYTFRAQRIIEVEADTLEEAETLVGYELHNGENAVCLLDEGTPVDNFPY